MKTMKMWGNEFDGDLPGVIERRKSSGVIQITPEEKQGMEKMREREEFTFEIFIIVDFQSSKISKDFIGC